MIKKKLIVIPKLTSTSINFLVGSKIEPDTLQGDVNKKIEQILSFFDAQQYIFKIRAEQ